VKSSQIDWEKQWTPDLPYEPNGVPSRRRLSKWENNVLRRLKDDAEAEARAVQAEKSADVRRKVLQGLPITPQGLEAFKATSKQQQQQQQPLEWQPSRLPRSVTKRGSGSATSTKNPLPGLSFLLPPTPPYRSASEPPPSKPKVLKVNLDLLNYNARQAQAHRNFSVAVEIWEKCLALDPSDGRAWLGLARHSVNSKKGRAVGVEHAREIYADGLRSCPGNPYLLQACGVLEERQGDIPKAMELYNEALKCDPTHAASWVSKGRLEQRLRRCDDSRLSYRRAVEAQPASYYAWHCWAMLEADAKNFKEARLLFQRSLNANPRNAATYQSWGVFEAKQGNLENATALFKKGLKWQPRNTHLLQAWAAAEGRRGNTHLAVELFERAIEVRPSDAGVYQAYAVLSAELGDAEGARRLFALGTKVDKTHLKTYHFWGLMEADQGNLEAARSVFQQGAWAAPRGKGIAELWQAWALTEAKQGYPPEDDFAFPTDYADSSGQGGSASGLDTPFALKEARKYFQFAMDASQQAYPTAVVVSWAKVEERYGFFGRSRALFEEAALKDGDNKRLWGAFESFEARRGNTGDRQRVNSRANDASISSLTLHSAQVRSALDDLPPAVSSNFFNTSTPTTAPATPTVEAKGASSTAAPPPLAPTEIKKPKRGWNTKAPSPPPGSFRLSDSDLDFLS